MRNSDFENHIFRELHQHKTPVNAESIWQEVAPLLPEKRKKGFFWWWTGAVAAIAILISLWILLTPHPKAEEKGPVASSSSIDQTKPLINKAEILLPPPPETVEANVPSPVPSFTASLLPVDRKKPSLLPINQQPNLRLPIAGSGTKSLASLPILQTKKTTSPPLPLIYPANNNNGLKYSLSIPVQAHLALRNMEATSPFGNSLKEQKEQREQSLEVLESGIDFSVHHPSKLYIRTGLHFTRISERYSSSQFVLQQDTIPFEINEINIDRNGDTSFVNGPLEQFQKVQVNRDIYNSFNLLEIPVGIGYQFWESPRWSLNAEAGVYFNLLNIAEGLGLSPEGEETDLADLQPAYYRTRTGPAYFAQVQAGYFIRQQIQLRAGFSVRSYSGSFTTQAYPLEQNYLLLGAHLTTAFYLN
jgi:hypothetical protein